jgi:hypothetical protein
MGFKFVALAATTVLGAAALAAPAVASASSRPSSTSDGGFSTPFSRSN